MKKKIFFIVAFILSVSFINSQKLTKIPLQYDTSGYASETLQKTYTPTLVLTPSINAEMSVNEAGALTYNLPIEIHKGINDFQPNVALTYNSQSGNGMAGWGWNIVGLSTISRGGKSKEIDGITIGAQFNDNDPFYLDGQRLIKIDANNFVTEKFSKIKITKNNSGEFQFIVKYTDGKIAKYKELITGQYYISSIQDSFGNSIQYTYQVEDYVPRVTKISYGENAAFSIDFQYKLRQNPTEAYRNGLKFITKYILSSVESNSTYDGVFRKYILTHDLVNSNTTERIRRIDVENKSGSKLKPLEFDYNLGVTTGTIEKSIESNAGFVNDTKQLGDIVAGDFYGKGKMSTCFISMGTDGNFSLVSSKNGKLSIPVTNGSKLIAGKVLSSDGKLSERDQLIIAHTGLYSKLQIVDLLTMESRMIDTEFQGNGTWTWNIATGQYTLDLSKSSDNYVSGDFNNDGLTDLIHFIQAGAYNSAEIRMFEVGKTIGTSTTTLSFTMPNAQYFYFDKVFQIEMDGDGIPELMFLTGDKYSVYKIDFLNKNLIPLDNLQQVTLSNYEYNSFTQQGTPLIFGDYNGDGLTDFMTPKKIYRIDDNNNAADVVKKMETEPQLWWEYISTGKTFIATSKDYTAQHLSYIVPSQRSYVRPGGSFWKLLWSGPEAVYDFTEYGSTTIIPTDFNQDGKTDLISFSKFGKVKYSDTQKLNLAQVNSAEILLSNGIYAPSPALYANKLLFHENKANTLGTTSFSTLNTVLPLNNDLISPFAIPLEATSFNQLNTYKSSLIISDPFTGKDISYTINNDSFTDKLIKKVSNGSGVDQLVEYRPMAMDTNTNTDRCYIYKQGIGEESYYPFYVHKNNGVTYLTHKIHTLFDGKILSKEYRYENGIQQLFGKGFLGFQKTYLSDAYESELKNGKYINKNPAKAVFWNITTRDPLLDNAIIKSTYGGLNKFLTETTITNKKFDKGNHQYLILSTDEITKDNLKKITSSKTYEYDEANDLRLKTAHTDFNGIGSELSKYTYKPEFFNGEHYFYGKIETSETTVYKDGLSFHTKNETDYYPNGSVIENRKFGNDPSAPPITSSFTYDNTYGNLKTETSFTIGVTAQTITYDYDITHRFKNKITTPDGLFSTSSVNTLGYSDSETSLLGLTESYERDEWGNIIEITDFLGKKTSIWKSIADVSTGGVYNVHKRREGGIETIVTFDKFDRPIQSKIQSINNKWILSKTEYDIYGKKVKTSEDFFEGDPIKWNTIEYDELNRPVKNITFTGKVITTCYEGMKVTVDDGYKKTSKTLDAMGHIVRQQDHGGTLSFSYFPNGALRESNYEGIKTTFEIDGWGNKKKVIDPSAGTFSYEYDNINRKTKETTPKGYTLFTYDNLGRLKTEKIYGNSPSENTSIEKIYNYNGQTKLLETVTGNSNGKSFTYTNYYDQYYRVKGKKEETPDFTYTTNTTFDILGKADEVILTTTIQNSNYTTSSKIKNIYDSNGILIQQNDILSNRIIWHLSATNAKGQTTQMEYGNGYTLTNQYNPNDFSLYNIKHQNTNNGTVALDVDYSYDVNKGVLNWRRNNSFGRKEDFTYDKLNRLLSEAINGNIINEYTYDKRGRITSNTELGKYSYNETDYKLQGIDFNTNGQSLNSQRGFATITYNAFKSPLRIQLTGKDDLNFEYNLLQSRYSMISSVTGQTKFYSSDFAIEISKQNDGKTQIITYITGDPYSANYIKKEIINNGSLLENENYFLHRDNLGSVLAITKASDGTAVEKRFFDAWGNLKGLIGANGQTITDIQQLRHISLFLDRGYTGHEHLQSVGLINMNARLYDPILRKFLSPDNLVADPSNTQSYDRFGYVYNNPLLYVDTDGNEPISIGITIVIAVAVSITSNMIMNAIQGVPVWYGLGKAAVTGAVMGALSFGIGSATSGVTNFIGKSALQAGMHSIAGGMMSALETSNFGSGFLSGAVSSIISSGIHSLGIDFSTGGANSFGTGDMIKATMIVGGGLSGGLSSTIAGGKFWQGFRQGIITAGLNHVGHMAADWIGPFGKKFKTIENVAANDKFESYENNESVCFKAAKAQTINGGGNPGGPLDALQVFGDNDYQVTHANKKGEYGQVLKYSFVEAMKLLMSELSAGKPITVGVTYARNEVGNHNRITDHFITVVGMGYDAKVGKNFFSFYDNYGTTRTDLQTNRLYIHPNRAVIGQGYGNNTYQMTEVRPNMPVRTYHNTNSVNYYRQYP